MQESMHLKIRSMDSNFSLIVQQLCDLGMFLTPSELCFLICKKKVLTYALAVGIIMNLGSL